jgi:hypothetical protein
VKVQLHAEARFYFRITISLIRQLSDLSKRHYDGECQRASARAGAPIRPGSSVMQPTNGILTIWRDRFRPGVTSDTDEVEVSATWRELELIAKICETAESTQLDVETFAFRIKRMFAVAGPKVMKDWKLEFEA